MTLFESGLTTRGRGFFIFFLNPRNDKVKVKDVLKYKRIVRSLQITRSRFTSHF